MTFTYTCIIIDDDLTHLTMISEAVCQVPGIRLAHTYTSFVEGLAFLQSSPKKVDIVFCDIMLLDANGLDHGPELAGLCRLLVYVTSHVHLKSEVLDVSGDDCLIKPITPAIIQSRVLSKLVKRYGDEMPLYIRFNKLFMYDGTAKVTYQARIKHVYLLIHKANYLDIYTYDKKEHRKYTVRCTVEHAMMLLEPVGVFIQINPSTIANANFVADFSATTVLVETQTYKVTAAYQDHYKTFVNTNTLGKRSHPTKPNKRI